MMVEKNVFHNLFVMNLERSYHQMITRFSGAKCGLCLDFPKENKLSICLICGFILCIFPKLPYLQLRLNRMQKTADPIPLRQPELPLLYFALWELDLHVTFLLQLDIRLRAEELPGLEDALPGPVRTGLQAEGQGLAEVG
jgi:hypothetical protein